MAREIPHQRISRDFAAEEFGPLCQRLLPWPGTGNDVPLGMMACALDPHSSSEPDQHDQDELMVILRGSGIVVLDDVEEEFTSGDVVFFPATKEHIVRNVRDEPMEWIAIYWPLHERH